MNKFKGKNPEIAVTQTIPDGFDQILTNNESMIKLLWRAKALAPRYCNILILGETGTGKEIMAQAIHVLNGRDRLVAINVNSVPSSLWESSFFGYRKGAFTGASQSQSGYLEKANLGTLFLDEIGDLDLCSQSKLLRVIEEKKFCPLGSIEARRSDFRLITATNKDLKAEVLTGRFRSDLYYRLNTTCIDLPPLRKRGNDTRFMQQNYWLLFAKKME